MVVNGVIYAVFCGSLALTTGYFDDRVTEFEEAHGGAGLEDFSEEGGEFRAFGVVFRVVV